VGVREQIEFRLLGEVEVERDGVVVDLGRRRERCLLGLLLLEANSAVPVDRLIDLLWDGAPPPAARASLHAHVSRLRRQLDPDGDGGLGARLVSQHGGYLVEVPAARVDAHRFRAMVAGARGLTDPVRRSVGLRRALALWRGPLMAGVASDRLREWVGADLVEGRLVATELAIEADLAAGRAGEVLSELGALIGEYPLREGLRARLMLALYRSGRQAEALEVFRDTRRLLVEQLGIEPGPELQELQRRILARDPRLGLSPPAPEPGSRNDLPGDIVDFTGRREEVGQLLDIVSADAGAGTAVILTAIDGMAGIGKTALAVHVAHQLGGRYPDAALFINLHAHSADQEPVAPAVALDTLLRALGVAADRVPDGLDERSALWRAELAGRRAVVVLDNAASAAQVRPLLPGTAGCLALITSRRRLTDLEAVHSLSLDVLPPADAVALFAGVSGARRAASDPGGVEEVLRLCGYLPLAIRIAAARLRTRPAWTVGHLAERLAEGELRLVELAAGDRSVAAAFALSYQHLTAAQQRLFRLLGLVACPDFDRNVAAALTGTDPGRAGWLLEELVDAHLLLQPAPGRYRFHDLLREHASMLVSGIEPDDVRTAAVGRLLDYYLHATYQAMSLVDPRGIQIEMAPAQPQVPVPSFPDQAAALDWLDAEYANLIVLIGYAAQRGWPVHTWQLSDLLHYLFYLREYTQDWLATHRLALAAARSLGDQFAEAQVLKSLGLVSWMVSRYDDALDHHGRALGLYRRAGNRVGEGEALNYLGLSNESLGRFAEASRYYRQSAALRRASGNQRGAAAALHNLANVYDRLGRYEDAIEQYRQAMTFFQEIGDQRAEAIVLSNLGLVHERLGQYDEALRNYQECMAVTRRSGDQWVSSNNMTNLGNVYRRLGRHAESIEYQTRALALVRESGLRGKESEVLNNFGATRLAAGQLAEALGLYRQALTLAVETGLREEEAHAHCGLGDVLRDSDPQTARRHWEFALASYTDLGLPEAERVREELDKLGTEPG
jgi:DNA-binding SARP family transcriptional activator/tetratricopeptide (TPR) repeat protein